MFSLIVECADEERELLVEELWSLGTEGIIERDGSLEAFFEDADRGPELVQHFAARKARTQEAPQRDWQQQFEDSFHPLEIGEKFFLVPPWRNDPTPEGRMRLEILPGRACGTGWHPCTQMVIGAMERYLQPGDSFLDVGTGSGILSAAAKMLGAERIASCDIDPDVVEVARERLENPVFVGSAPAVRSQSFDFVVANISEEAVRTLLPDLERIARRRLILSGFTGYDNPPAHLEELERGEWNCYVC